MYSKKDSSLPKKTEMLVKTIEAYRLLIDVYKVEHYKTAATSAMRDATNASEILDLVEKKTGMRIDVITGEEEANYLLREST
jgi:exopolyphosphatase/guanosine-5'-triphosphate,3'-diphosphate pyrophosphatase